MHTFSVMVTTTVVHREFSRMEMSILRFVAAGTFLYTLILKPKFKTQGQPKKNRVKKNPAAAQTETSILFIYFLR